MAEKIQDQIVQFNLLFKRYNDIYRSAAKEFDMPELALWIIYSLREKEECTQKDLVDLLLQPKQSIHSALRMLVKDGYVVLECPENNHRSKYIHLTEKGIALAENTADKIVCAENNAFQTLSGRERETLLNLFEQLTTILHKEMQKVGQHLV